MQNRAPENAGVAHDPKEPREVWRVRRKEGWPESTTGAGLLESRERTRAGTRT